MRRQPVHYGLASFSLLTMRIAKPLLLVLTPIGVVFGIYEGWRLVGGLVILMLALLGFISIAMLSVVRTIKREREEEERKKRESEGSG